MTELLKTLCTIPAVSSNEDKLREFIINEVSPYADCTTDKNGNLICFKKGKKRPLNRVMLDAHMDEVGIIATSITSDGFIKFATVGGIDASVMLCRGVVFENGVRGVVGLKPVHLASAEEKKKMPSADELYIDIGAKDKTEAEKLVKPGQTAVFESEATVMGDRIKARAIDDRAGVACLIALLKQEAEFDFYATFTWGEEVGGRGAKTAAFTVEPDIAIVLEATTAADIHGTPKEDTVCRLGDGPAVSFMDRATLYDRKLYDIALASGIKCQTKNKVAGGNNSGAIHLSKGGVPTIAISLPCRYIHSPSCLADLGDLEDMKRLAEYMLSVTAGTTVYD